MLVVQEKEIFDVMNQKHREIAHQYLLTSVVEGKPTWGVNGCPFKPSAPFHNIDVQLRTQMLSFFLTGVK